MARKFVLDFHRAPGDVLMVSALVRDLKRTYGDRYDVTVKTNFPAIWRNNPFLANSDLHEAGVEVVKLNEVRAMQRSQNGQQRHYVSAYHWDFEQRTKVRVPLLAPKGDLYLDEIERTQPLVFGRYWVIVAGGKTDTTNKIWPQMRYQEVVDRLRCYGLRFVQEGAVKAMHAHRPLERVLCLLGRTSQRDLMVNIYHADGVICPVTFPMHLAAVWDKPCVVIAGGREEPWWEWYGPGEHFGPNCAAVKTPHRFLHTVGQLSCCPRVGCWRRRTLALRDNHPEFDKKLCPHPILRPRSETVAECMDMIQVDHVVEAVMSYYTDGTLPLP